MAAAVVLVAVLVAALLLRDADDVDETVADPVAPLTGLVAGPIRPALAVKVDAVDAARPQVGLAAADVVVEAQVEGGLTRFLAVYSSADPGQVGPVRSVRPTDLSLAELLGRPALASSGGAGPVLELVDAAAADGDVVPLDPDVAPDAFSRDPDRTAPHDLLGDAGALWEAAAPEAQAPAPLFAFGAAAPASPAAEVEVAFPAVDVAWRWDAERSEWLRAQDGTDQVDAEAPDVALGVPNVVVLVVGYAPSPTDAASPVADLTSGGDALVLRDGAVARCRWSTDPTAVPRISLVAADGTTCALTPGRSWIELAPAPPTVLPVDG